MGRPKRTGKLDPVSAEMLKMEQEREESNVLQWTTTEVAQALKKSCVLIWQIAEELGIKTRPHTRGQVTWWSLTDVFMVMKALKKRERPKPTPRDHKKAVEELREAIRQNGGM